MTERPIILSDSEREDLEIAYREFGATLWLAVWRTSGRNRDIADEAVAEAFAQAGRRFRSIESLRPWVYRAAFRIAAGELKRRGSSGRVRLEDVPEAVADLDESYLEITDAIKTLSPMQQAAFFLRVILGYSSDEAAQILGVSSVSIRVHLHAGRRRLREAGEEQR